MPTCLGCRRPVRTPLCTPLLRDNREKINKLITCIVPLQTCDFSALVSSRKDIPWLIGIYNIQKLFWKSWKHNEAWGDLVSGPGKPTQNVTTYYANSLIASSISVKTLFCSAENIFARFNILSSATLLTWSVKTLHDRAQENQQLAIAGMQTGRRRNLTKSLTIYFFLDSERKQIAAGPRTSDHASVSKCYSASIRAPIYFIHLLHSQLST